MKRLKISAALYLSAVLLGLCGCRAVFSCLEAFTDCAYGNAEGSSGWSSGYGQSDSVGAPCFVQLDTAAANGMMEHIRFKDGAAALGTGRLYSGGEYDGKIVFESGAGAKLKVVVFAGKTLEGESFSFNGLTATVSVDMRRREDYFEFECRAVVAAEGESVLVEYGYASQSEECEIYALLSSLFEARG